jgi:hypothetical protein
MLELNFKFSEDDERDKYAWYDDKSINIIIDNLIVRKNESYKQILNKIVRFFLIEYNCSLLNKIGLFKKTYCAWEESNKLGNCIILDITDRMINEKAFLYYYLFHYKKDKKS